MKVQIIEFSVFLNKEKRTECLLESFSCQHGFLAVAKERGESCRIEQDKREEVEVFHFKLFLSNGVKEIVKMLRESEVVFGPITTHDGEILFYTGKSCFIICPDAITRMEV